jgi:hypothetical protein
MQVHSAHAKHTLYLDKMLGEMKVWLDAKERDLDLHEAVLVEAQSQGLNPRDNYEELMELAEIQRCLEGAEVEHVIEAGRLVILVGEIPKVLVDLGMPPILRIPHDPRMAGNIMEAADTVLDHLREAYSSGHDPWDSVPLVLLSPCPLAVLLLFLSTLFFLFICKYLETLGFQCLNALGPAVKILSSASIRVGCGSCSTGCVFARVPNCNKLGALNLGSPATSLGLERRQS